MEPKIQRADDLVGYAWLARQFDLETVATLPSITSLGARVVRHEIEDDPHDRERIVLRQHDQPLHSERWHLQLALKHEGVHLELLDRLFRKTGFELVRGWLAEEPTSQHARRAGFLYEWLTGRQVEGHDLASGNYVDAIDAERYLAANHPTPNRRWRVNDNLPGTPQWCPMMRLSSQVRKALELDVPGAAGELMKRFGQDTILRSASWLSTKESQASFAIERESDQDARIRRFAAAIAQHCGRIDEPLSALSLLKLQRSILGDRTSGFHLGMRKSPVFVGRTVRMEPVIDYLAPHHEFVPGLMQGLRQFAERTAGGSTVARAAALSFGFVYIHPLSDGNGRISRFLINDTLRRDGALPAPLILPVSAVIQSSMAEYERTLESLSVPLMNALAGRVRISRDEVTEYADGVRSNLVLEDDGWQEASSAWRYPDLSRHVRYMSQVLARTLHQEIPKEATYLQGLERARSALKGLVEAPDADIDRIANSIQEHGRVTKRLLKDYPSVFGEGGQRAGLFEQAVRRSFDAEVDDSGDGDDDANDAPPSRPTCR